MTTDNTAVPVPGLRDQIAGAVDDCRVLTPEALTDAVLAVVQPVIDKAQQRAEGAEGALAKVRGIDPDKLDLLADWFDTDDARKGPGRNFAVQADLRQWARTLRALAPPVPADQPEGGVG